MAGLGYLAMVTQRKGMHRALAASASKRQRILSDVCITAFQCCTTDDRRPSALTAGRPAGRAERYANWVEPEKGVTAAVACRLLLQLLCMCGVQVAVAQDYCTSGIACKMVFD